MSRSANARLRVERLDDRIAPAAGLDPTFSDDGRAVIDIPDTDSGLHRFAVQADGGVLVNAWTGGENLVYRLRPDGTPDAAFGTDGAIDLGKSSYFATPTVGAAAGGVFYVGTPTIDGYFGVSRFTADGTPDATFGTDGRANVASLPIDDPLFLNGRASATLNGLLVQADGKVVLYGYNASGFFACRLDAAGELDPTFGTGGAVRFADSQGWFQATMRVSDAAVSASGKLVFLITGGKPSPGGFTPPSQVVVRLNADGSADATFDGDGAWDVLANTPDATTTGLYSLAVRPDDRVLLYGSVPDPVYYTTVGLIGLTATGELDPTFGTDGRVSRPNPRWGIAGRSLGLLPDGRVVFVTVGGENSEYAQHARVEVLNPDGSPAEFFADGASAAEIRFPNRGEAALFTQPDQVAVAADGRIFVLTANDDPMRTFLPPYVREPDLGVTVYVQDGGTTAPLSPADPPIDPISPTPEEPTPVDPDPLPPVEVTTVDPGTTTVDPPTPVPGLLGEWLCTLPPVEVTTAGPPSPQIIVGVGGATGGRVELVRTADTGTVLETESVSSVEPFPGFTGAVRVVTADVDGDGVTDQIYAAGPGGGSRVRVEFGKPLSSPQREPVEFSAFEAGFTGGVSVAVAGGLLVVTPDVGGGPVVAVYRMSRVLADGSSVQPDVRFFGIDDPAFRGGARATIADVNADGTLDLIVAAGQGGGPRVAVFDGGSVAGFAPRRLANDFFAFEPTLRDGVYLTAADLNRDGFAEVLVGGGPGGAPRVTAFDGKELLSGRMVARADFFAGDPTGRDGVTLAVKTASGRTELLTGADGMVRAYSSAELLAVIEPTASFDFAAADAVNAVFVG